MTEEVPTRASIIAARMRGAAGPKLEAMATLLADYREGEVTRPSADHVGRWLRQFEADDREPILDELLHVWSQLYFNREKARQFMALVAASEKLCGTDPRRFWLAANILQIQTNGQSQRDMLALLDAELSASMGVQVAECGGGGQFVYLDDVSFTGGRILTDLLAWLPGAPTKATLNIDLLALHTSAKHWIETSLEKAALAAGKDINIQFRRQYSLESRKHYRRSADVLWPASLPPAAGEYAIGRYPFEPRPLGGPAGFFTSEAKRHILEQAFTTAGARIRSFSANSKAILRPLGYSQFGVGFGSLFLSYRNCPNNAPLALWWGDTTMRPTHPFSKWHPLVPRRTYGGDDG